MLDRKNVSMIKYRRRVRVVVERKRRREKLIRDWVFQLDQTVVESDPFVSRLRSL